MGKRVTKKKKPSLRDFLNKESPSLLHKYDALYNYKL